jgi:hypothetical protein
MTKKKFYPDCSNCRNRGELCDDCKYDSLSKSSMYEKDRRKNKVGLIEDGN